VPRVRRGSLLLPAALTILSLALMAAGYLLGDPSLILRKAASVCLECIGVG
jgi:hypothetical protein